MKWNAFVKACSCQIKRKIIQYTLNSGNEPKIKSRFSPIYQQKKTHQRKQYITDIELSMSDNPQCGLILYNGQNLQIQKTRIKNR